MKSRILIATHQPYIFPDLPLYEPVQAGAVNGKAITGCLRDDRGDNISAKNPFYSELTVLYWAWRNGCYAKGTLGGLVHYRRHFKGEEPFGRHRILGAKEIADILKDYDVIVPSRRRYYIETVQSHYAHAHHSGDLSVVREVLQEKAPEYLEAFDRLMERRSLHLYNMFVMSAERIDAYCRWLFPLLFESEKHIDYRSYDSYQRRVMGFLGERLFNVWLIRNEWRLYERGVVNLEGENLFRKGWRMIGRKIFS